MSHGRVPLAALACITALWMASVSARRGEPHHQPAAPGPLVDAGPEHWPFLLADIWSERIAQITDIEGSNWSTGPAAYDTEWFNPWHIAVDCQGRIYAADRNNNRIVRMDDLSGAGWTQLSGVTGRTPLNWPKSITIDGSGRLYVLDSARSPIIRIDDMTGAGWTEGPAGNPQNSLFNAKKLVFDATGRFYVSDTDNHRVVRFDTLSGANWKTFGSFGSGVGQFNRPEGIALDALGRIYLTDNENHRIVRIDDMNGTNWVSYGTQGAGIGQFWEPHDIAVQDPDRIYVLDTGNARVVRLDDMTGTGWRSVGSRWSTGCGEGQHCRPGVLEFVAPKGLALHPAYVPAPSCANLLPAAPRNLAGRVSGHAVNLSWTPSLAGGAIDNYTVILRHAAGGSIVASQSVGRVLSATINLWVGSFVVSVRGVNASGIGAESSGVPVVIDQPGAPGAPGAPRISGTGNAVTVSWTAPISGSPATAYTVIARGTCGGGVVATLPAGNTLSISVTAPSGAFCVSVQASNPVGSGLESPGTMLTVPLPFAPPHNPSNLMAQVAGTTVQFSFTEPTTGPPPSSYVLLASLSTSGPIVASLPFAAPASGQTVTRVPAGTYYVRVAAVNAAGTSPSSNEVQVVVTGPQPPAAPVLNAPVVNGHAVTLSWAHGPGAPPNVTIHARLSPGGLVVATLTGLTGTSLTVTAPSGTYYVHAVAVDDQGVSANSNQIIVTVP